MCPKYSNKKLVFLSSAILLAGIVFLTQGCSGGASGPSQPTLESIAITPLNPSVSVGATEQLVATGTYSDGTSQSLPASLSWTTSAPSTVTVSQTGLVTGIASGTATITATSGSISGNATLKVTAVQPSLASVAVTPSTGTVIVGATVQFAATGTYSDGTSKTLSSSVAWNSSIPNVATVNSSGLATGVAQGTSTITATSGSISGSAVLSVTAPTPTLQSISVSPSDSTIAIGAAQQFSATGTYSNGTTQNLTSSATWESSETTVASVSSAGLANADAIGTTTLTATMGSVVGTTQLTVVNPSVPRFAYVTNENGAISIYSVDPVTGQLRARGYQIVGGATPGSMGALVDTVGPIVVSPSGRYAYSLYTTSTAGYIASFAIDPDTGFLTPTPGSPYVATSTPQRVAIEPRGLYIYVAQQGGVLSAFAIDQSTGALTPIAGDQSLGSDALAVAADPAAEFVYAVSGNGLYGFSILPNGALSSVLGSPYTVEHDDINASIALAPSGSLLFIASGNAISGFSVNPATGVLTQSSAPPYPLEGAPVSEVVSPLGTFLYVAVSQDSNCGEACVQVYSILSTGELAPVQNSPFSVPNKWFTLPVAASSITIDPAGSYVYVTDVGSGNVTVYQVVTSTGALAEVSSVVAQQAPTSIALALGVSPIKYHPSYLYAISSGSSGGVSAFSVDTGNGSLNTVQGSPFSGSSGPQCVATDPLGRFMYVVNNASNSISVFEINASTGALAQGTSVPLNSPECVVVDGAGLVAYVTYISAQNQGMIAVYKIDQSSGALTVLNPGIIPIHPTTGQGLYAAVIDPSGRYLFAATHGSGSTPGQILGFTINPLGDLAPSSLLGNTEGGLPASFAVDPSGTALYVVNSGTANSVQSFLINPRSGDLALWASTSTTSSPSAIAVDQSGKYVYVSEINPAALQAFSVVPGTAQLSAIPNSADVTLANPLAVLVDPSDAYVYLAGGVNTGYIASFTIDPTTGALTPQGQSSSTGGQVVTMAITGSSH
jgi:6-phosphogluconolactonase (cycloisomerase 2 family)